MERPMAATIFLDEIADMGQAIAGEVAALSRGRHVYACGRHGGVRVNVRLIAATNRDIVKAIAVRRIFAKTLSPAERGAI